MPITANDLRWYRSERMTDEDDGGGRLTSQEIVWGMENQVFDDLSDVDRAAGDVSIRKVYAAIASQGDDKYLDAGVVVLRPPVDPNVSVVAFSSGDFYDERKALGDRLASQIARGGVFRGWLWGDHITDQRSVTLWQRESDPLPVVGQRLELVRRESSVTQYTQMLWITRVLFELAERVDTAGSYRVRMVTCELPEGLSNDFPGIEPSRLDPGSLGVNGTLVYSTRYNAGLVQVVGAAPLAEAASAGAYTVKVESLYQPLIPTAFAETAIPDQNPGSGRVTMVPARTNSGGVTYGTAPVIGPGITLHLPTPVLPGSFEAKIAPVPTPKYSDNNGSVVYSGTSVKVGTIDYATGVVAWSSETENEAARVKEINYEPAGCPLRVANSASQLVTVENRGFLWLLTLAPIPARGTTEVSYRVNNEWYTLADRGAGALIGSDSAQGSGSINFDTGTALITTGALPDPDSQILYSWSPAVDYVTANGAVSTIPRVTLLAAHPGIAKGTLEISFTDPVGTPVVREYSDDGAGKIVTSGDVLCGTVNYSTGVLQFSPEVIPPSGTTFYLSYDYGNPVEEVFEHPLREPDSKLLVTLDAVPRAGMVEVEWNTLILDWDPISLIANLKDPVVTAFDDGNGHLLIGDEQVGTINYGAKTINWNPDRTLSVPIPIWEMQEIGTMDEDGTEHHVWRRVFVGWEYIATGASYPNDTTGYVKVRYRPAGGDTAVSLEPIALTAVEFDVSKNYAQRLVRNSLFFQFGTHYYSQRGTALVRDIDPLTGASTQAGSVDRNSGVVRLTSWNTDLVIANDAGLPILAMATEVGTQPIDFATFRAPISPLKPGVLQIRYTTIDGVTKSKTVDSSGYSVDGDATISADYQRGVIAARFGRWRVVSELTQQELESDWYDAAAVVNRAGVPSIWQSTMVEADSLIYNAVASTMLPPDSRMLGLDAARLPPDGKALLFQVGQLVLVHHTDEVEVQSLAAGQAINCGRAKIYRVVIEDSAMARLPADLYVVNRDTGVVTMVTPLDVGDYTPPFRVIHTIADLQRLRDTDINGNLTMLRALGHAYPEGSYCSAMLYLGTLQARVSDLFEQTTWTGEWSDELIGDQPLASYNDAAFPIIVANNGAYKDRILVKFTTATTFQVIGENLGLIGIGTTNGEVDGLDHYCAPINQLTGQPYFKIDYRGWGGAWATGNCLRFNLHAASYPIDLVRAVQPSDPTGEQDCVELLLVGNIDA